MTQTTYIVNIFRNSRYELEAAFPDQSSAETYLSKAYQRLLDTGKPIPDYQVIKCDIESTGGKANEGAVFSTMKISPVHNVAITLSAYPEVAKPAIK